MRDKNLCSRREADTLIEKGLVTVDGQVATQLGLMVDPASEIKVSEDPASRGAPLTIALHKPRSFISQAVNAREGQRFAWQLLTWENQAPSCTYGRGGMDGTAVREPFKLRKLGCCGRLDLDSSGLLVFSQDGRVARSLVGQNEKVGKHYAVDVAVPCGSTLPEQLEELAERLRYGLSLDGELLKPADVAWVARNPEAWEDHLKPRKLENNRRARQAFAEGELKQFRMTLYQGKYRQIRRMCDLVGLEVRRLQRLRIGSISLSTLGLEKPGSWRVLDSSHVASLQARSIPELQ